MPEHERPLSDGRIIARVGDTIRRPPCVNSEFVRQLLATWASRLRPGAEVRERRPPRSGSGRKSRGSVA